MSLALDSHKVVALYPRSVATNATASVTVDTLGFNHAKVYVNVGVASSDVTVMHISDGTASNNFATISTFVGGTGFTIPSANTSSGYVAEFSVDLRKRNRYLRLQVENTSAATVVSGEIILGRAEIAPDTTTERGCAVFVAG